MLSIINAPNPVLSKKAKRVLKIDKNILKLIEEMKTSLALATDPIGVGLAAPQISESIRIFIAKPTPKAKVSVFINPVITKVLELKSDENKKTTKLEGCLSLPDIWGYVQRYNQISVSYLDEIGRKHTKTYKGFMATIVQHEVDHLNGILFPKRVLEQRGTLYKSHKNRKGEDIFEEFKI